MNYLKKIVYNVFTITPDIQGGVLYCKRSPLKLLNKILKKYLRKTSILVRSQVLLTANRLIFLNISMGLSKIHDPRFPCVT